MTRPPPPLRFLGLVVGLWICGRVALLAPQAWVEPGRATPAAAAVKAIERVVETRPARPVVLAGTHSIIVARPAKSPMVAFPGETDQSASRTAVLATLVASDPTPMLARSEVPLALRPAPPPSPPRIASRWSASTWVLVRAGDGETALAPGGTLGASQAGARLLYRLNRDPARPLSLSARAYVPLRDRGGAEAAVGIDWRPLAGLPLNLLVERRQAVGSRGRSSFAATLYGGHSADLPGGLRFDGYAQAGIVGLRRRDAFADGSARVSLPVGRVEIGASAWGAAQPGAARLDAGPHVAFRLPAGGADWRLQADWRFRLAGDAAPGSGPAITLSTDF